MMLKQRCAFSLWAFIFLLAVVPAQADVYMFRDEAGAAFFTNLAGQGRIKVRLPLKKEPRTVKATQASAKDFAADRRAGSFDLAIVSAGELFAVDPDIIRAVIRAESNFNPYAVSPKGAQGLMQLMPATSRDMNVTDPFDPAANIYGGARYLRQLLGGLNEDLSLALAAYNAGPSRVASQNGIPPIKETRDYVGKVLNFYRGLKERNAM